MRRLSSNLSVRCSGLNCSVRAESMRTIFTEQAVWQRIKEMNLGLRLCRIKSPPYHLGSLDYGKFIHLRGPPLPHL